MKLLNNYIQLIIVKQQINTAEFFLYNNCDTKSIFNYF